MSRRQFTGCARPFHPHHCVEFPGQLADCRGQDVAAPVALIGKNAALDTHQRLADGLGRGLPLLEPGVPGKMAHAEQRHEGDGDMGPDPALGPVEDRPYLQVMPGVAKGLFHLLECSVMAENIPWRHVGQVGHHAMNAVPAGLLAGPFLVHHQFGLALNPQEPLVSPVAEQLLRIGTSCKPATQLAERPLSLPGILGRPLRRMADHDPAALMHHLLHPNALCIRRTKAPGSRTSS